MSDLTPPDEPLDEATRARIRQRVVAGVDDSRRTPTSRGWLVPVGAAAAVGVLVAGAVFLGRGDDDREVGPADQESATPSVSPTDEATQDPTPEPTLEPTEPTEPTEGPVERPGRPSACDAATQEILPGAEPVATGADQGSTTTFYVKGDRFTLCDDYEGTSSTGNVTVHHPKPLDGTGGDRNPYELSSEFPGGTAAHFVAGGPVPDGNDAFQVTYTFPDGNVQVSADIDTPSGQRWWLMVYDAADLSTATNGPPTVEVRGGPPAEPLDLTDICAQANHGC